jgi:hypothetical protein
MKHGKHFTSLNNYFLSKNHFNFFFSVGISTLSYLWRWNYYTFCDILE